MKIVKPFEYIDPKSTDIICFLAGGCTNNEWREEVYSYLQERPLYHLILVDPYNPNITNAKEQIQWEHLYLTQYSEDNFIFSVYFDKYTNQPISMFELGRATILSKQEYIDYNTKEHSGAIIVRYGYPIIVSCHNEAPKKEDIKIQCELSSVSCKERTPIEHAEAIIREYQYIKHQMGV